MCGLIFESVSVFLIAVNFVFVFVIVFAIFISGKPLPAKMDEFSAKLRKGRGSFPKFRSCIPEIIAVHFPERGGGGGQRPFVVSQKIHPFWRIKGCVAIVFVRCFLFPCIYLL